MKNLAVWAVTLLLAMGISGCETTPDTCEAECNFECVDLLVDPVNCGGCGVVCPTGTTCENGGCQCPGTNELCDGVCEDVMTDRHNCGGCGVLCTYDSECVAGECGEYLHPYGTLTMDFTTAFIFDGDRFFTDAAYQSDNWDAGVSESPTATGTFGAALTIPGASATDTISFAQHLAADANRPIRIEVDQLSFLGPTYSADNAANPNVRVVFPGDDLQDQEYDVDAADLAETASPWVYVFNQVTALSICVLAVGSGGTLVVTAESTTDVDGGSMTLQTTGLPLFHPTNTPYGDITTDILSMGILVCDIE